MKVIVHIANTSGLEETNQKEFLNDLMQEFSLRRIHYSFIKINTNCDEIIDEMMQSYSRITVVDLSKEINDEITGKFIDAAS